MITVNGKEVDFEEGMTVAEALQAAGEALEGATLVVVDGRVIPLHRIRTTPLVDGSRIRLFPLLSGG